MRIPRYTQIVFRPTALLLAWQLDRRRFYPKGHKCPTVIRVLLRVDKGVIIPAGEPIGVDPQRDRERFKVSEIGIVVIAKKYSFG